jgi:hypothetical protein
VDTNTDAPRPGARGWARTGLYGGLLLSLAGNEAHVWGDGFPGWGPAVASIVWPALLFVALEIVLHMGPGYVWAKWVGLGSVAAVSGAVSYWHLSSVLRSWHYGPLAWFGPLAVDGLMVLSTVVLTRLIDADVPRPVVPVRPPSRVFAGPQSLPEPAPVPEQPAPEVHPVIPPQPNPPERVQPAKPADNPQRRPQGVHISPQGVELRGADLKADAILRVLSSVSRERPRGLTNTELAAQYVPPLSTRTAEAIGAEARKAIGERVNGHGPAAVIR